MKNRAYKLYLYIFNIFKKFNSNYIYGKPIKFDKLVYIMRVEEV